MAINEQKLKPGIPVFCYKQNFSTAYERCIIEIKGALSPLEESIFFTSKTENYTALQVMWA